MDLATAQITAISLLAAIGAEDSSRRPTQPQILGILASCNDVEIAAAQSAAGSRDRRVREFAAGLARDHRRSNADLDDLAKALGAVPWRPHQEEPENPAAAGAPADEGFLESQERAHEALLAELDDLAPYVKDPALGQTLRALRQTEALHRDQARRLASPRGD